MFLLFAALLVIADQATKHLAKSSFPGGSELELGLGFSLTYVRNTGAAFGIFRDVALPVGAITVDGTLLLGMLSAVVAAALLVYLWRSHRRLARLQLTALTLVMAGAAGNMIDRLSLGYVIDFIHFQVPGFNFPVFNLADSCVVVGAILLLLSGFLPERPVADEGLAARPLGEGEFVAGADSGERR